MKVPQLARYNGAVVKAYEFVENNIIEFPIKPFDLIKKFKWGLLTYEKMAYDNNCTIKDICECLGTDGYSIYNGNNYTIAYNNTIKSQGRINFTLMHEIGHIILHHHKDFDVTEVLEDNFTKAEYKILENEANCFARNVLAPAPLAVELRFLSTFFSIPDYFNITMSAATTRYSFLRNDLYYLTDKQIENFQAKYRRFKQCNVCSTKYLKPDVKHCPLCGNNKLVLGDEFTMKEYKGIDINSLGECPRCENYDLKSGDKFCKICGLGLHNVCSHCNMEMDSSARYCTECGNITTFFKDSLLDDWSQTTEVIEKSNELETDFQVSSVDDLPF